MLSTSATRCPVLACCVNPLHSSGILSTYLTDATTTGRATNLRWGWETLSRLRHGSKYLAGSRIAPQQSLTSPAPPRRHPPQHPPPCPPLLSPPSTFLLRCCPPFMALASTIARRTQGPRAGQTPRFCPARPPPPGLPARRTRRILDSQARNYV